MPVETPTKDVPPLADLIASARREHAMRLRVYPRYVERGKLDPKKAEHEIACMAQIVTVLENLQQLGLRTPAR